MIFDWTIIYNDGNGITVIKESDEEWDKAPDDNVQYVMCNYGGFREAISGLDEYTIPVPGTNIKYGKLISDEQWALTRQFMIAGNY
jgi:hypothetical protein